MFVFYVVDIVEDESDEYGELDSCISTNKLR